MNCMLYAYCYWFAPETFFFLAVLKKNRIRFFGTKFQYVILNLFVNFLIPFGSLCLQIWTHFVLLFDLVGPESVIQSMFVLECQVKYIRVGMIVKLLIINNSATLVWQVSDFITSLSIFLVSEAGSIIHLFHCVFKKFVNTISQMLAQLSQLWALTEQILSTLDIRLNSSCLTLNYFLILATVCFLLQLLSFCFFILSPPLFLLSADSSSTLLCFFSISLLLFQSFSLFVGFLYFSFVSHSWRFLLGCFNTWIFWFLNLRFNFFWRKLRSYNYFFVWDWRRSLFFHRPALHFF